MNAIFQPSIDQTSYRPASEISVHLIDALRNGDEATFSSLMELYYDGMLRMALIYVKDSSVAEDVIQETWVAVLRGIKCFEGRSSLKTWIFSILTKRAITRAHREGRYVSLSNLMDTDYNEIDRAISPEYFNGHIPRYSDFQWQPDSHPNAWDVVPEDSLLTHETLAQIHAAIQLLPSPQQQVIQMRDIEDWSATEVCEALGITEINQRVLLHRARAKVRQIVGRYLCVD